jgi:hypothetical protein
MLRPCRFDYDTLTSERNEINAELRKVIGQSIHDWGTSCTRFEIQVRHGRSGVMELLSPVDLSPIA